MRISNPIMIVYTYTKEKIEIADEALAAGGEGEVRKVLSCPSRFNNVCAKLYFKPKQTREQEQKIRFMVENPPDMIVGKGMMLAWPLETIYTKKDGGFLGFLMPTAFPDSKKLVILTVLKLNKSYKDKWHKFDKEQDKKNAIISRMKLIKNIAIPLHYLHRTNKYVLKDFKPDNVLVTPTGKVTIVDMDSIQICENGKLLFPGTAATEDYVPPEFFNEGIGRDTTIPLEKSWDNFAIGEVFYQILFGLKPYAVTPKTNSEDCNTIPYCISHNLFPYGKNTSQIAKIPDPHRNFEIIPQSLRELFIRAFSDSPDDRPQVKEWGQTIDVEIKKIPQSVTTKPNESTVIEEPNEPPKPPINTKYCPRCGTANDIYAKFCKSCRYSFDGTIKEVTNFDRVASFLIPLYGLFLFFALRKEVSRPIAYLFWAIAGIVAYIAICSL